MLKEAYEQGVRAAFEKNAGVLSKVLLNPATIGGALGAGGSLIADKASGKDFNWGKALGTGAVGSLVGLGVRHGQGLLTTAANKYPALRKHMLDQAGNLARGYADLGWMVPSMLAAPAIMAASGNDGPQGAAKSHVGSFFRGKR